MRKFSSFLADLAESLADKQIEVLVAGKQAELCYDREGKPTVLVLPEPEGEIDDETIRLYNGYVDHEISHVEYTDIRVRGDYKSKYKDIETALFIGQIAEDCHIERRRIAKWRGSESNLMAVFELKLWAEYGASFVEPKTIKDQVDNFLRAAPSFMRYLSGISGHQRFVNDYGHTCETVIEAMKRDRITLHDLDTPGAMNFAESVMQKLMELLDSDQSEPEDEEPEDSPDTEKHDSENESGGDEEQPEESNGGEKAPVSSSDGMNSDQSDLADLTTIELPGADVGDVLAGELSSDEPATSEYSIFSKAYDRYLVNILDCVKELGVSEEELNSLHMPEQVSRMTSHAQRLIQGRAQTGWQGNKLSGRIDPKRVNAFFKGDDRLFRRKYDSQDKSAAAVILVDMSYSMFASERMETALQAAYSLSMVMQGSGVKNIVLGHTTISERTRGRLPITLNQYLQLESSTKFNRIQPLLVPEIKGWEEHPNPRKFGFAEIEDLFMDNVDGEVLDACCNILSGRPESRKYVFIISDGYPDAIDGRTDSRTQNVYMQDLAKVTERWKGRIQMAGLGIQSDAVSNYFDKSAVVNDLALIPEAFIKLFNDLAITN